MTQKSMAWRAVAAALSAGLLMSAVMPAGALADTRQMSSQDTAKVAALTSKILALVNGMPTSSSEGAFEGVMVDAAQGFDAFIIVAALENVAGTPGVPAAVVAAAHRLERAFGEDHHHDNGDNGLLGGIPGLTAPGFASGGGGGTASSYTQ